MLNYAFLAATISAMNDTNAPEDFHQRLRRLMDEKNMTNEKLSELVGVNSSAVSHWVTGRFRPRTNLYEKIADALGVDLVYLMHGQGDENGLSTRISKTLDHLGPDELKKVAEFIDLIAKRKH